MPLAVPLVSNAAQKMASLADISGKYDYKYPSTTDGYSLDFRPDSDLCKRIVREVAVRAQSAHSEVQKRAAIWTEIAHCMNVYIPLNEAEQVVKANDPRRPVSIVVPMSFALRDTLLTYCMSALGTDPIYRYQGVGPEDTKGAIKLERLVNMQAVRAKHILAHRVQWSDALTYGYGMLAPIWEPRWGHARVKRPTTGIDAYGAPVVIGEHYEDTVGIVWEGHYLQSVHPRNCLIDPNVGEYELQRGEFAGYMMRDNFVGVLDWERSSQGRVFNAKYLRHTSGKSCLFEAPKDMISTDRAAPGVTYWNDHTSDTETKPVDLCHMYINLVPKDWGLGKSEYPEKWYFCIAGDSLVIAAEALSRWHNMFPLVVAAPDYDGHVPLSISRMEVAYPMQHLLNFLVNQHVEEQRKSVGGSIVYDPSIIYTPDLAQEGPVRNVRLRKTAWGRGKITEAFYRVPDSNVTMQNLADSAAMMQLMERVTGATSALQGIIRQGGSERLTATEARGAQSSAMGRLQALARIMGLQSIQDCAFILASQTQQFMTMPTQAAVLGRLSEELDAEYGTQTYMTVNPEDININYDVVASDGLTPNSDDPALWSEIAKTLIATPQGQQVLGTTFDIGRALIHTFREMGMKNVEDFRIRGVNPLQAQVVPDEQAMQQAQAGNLMPMGGMPRG